MSGITGGQLVGAALGLAAGFFFPPAGLSVYAAMSLGASIGMTIGGIFDPPPEQQITREGARLGDLSVQTSQWGTPIPRLFGAYRMAGNIFWSIPLIETKHVEESGEGKGGGGGTKTETIWYSYAGSWAVGFCEGEISGIVKIWFDSVLVYDGSNYAGGLAYGNHTVYRGGDDQSIDWYMQSKNSDSPAYRGLAYIVFREIELENYGNKIPKVSVELSKSGSSAATEQTLVEPFPVYSWRINSKLLYVDDTYAYTISAQYTNTYIDVKWVLSKTIISTGETATIGLGTLYKNQFCSLDANGNPIDPCSYVGNSVIYGKSTENIFMIFGGVGASIANMVTIGSECCNGTQILGLDGLTQYIVDGSYYNVGRYTYVYISIHGKLFKLDGDAVLLEVELSANLTGNNTGYLAYYNGKIYLARSLPTSIEITEYDSELLLLNTTIVDIPFTDTSYTNDFTVDQFGFHICYYGTYVHIDNEYNFINQVILPLLSTIDSYYFYNGKLYGFLDSDIDPLHDLKITIIDVYNFSADQVTVASIATELFERAGIPSSDFDVSEATSDLVNGYVLPRPMQTRSAIEPVISAYQFDLIETNSKLKLKKRNPDNIVDTIDDVIDFVQIDRIQNVELSRAINIVYANKDKNYDIGVQSSMRNDSNTENTKTYQYPLALSDNKAKQISEMYLYSEWNERTEFKFSTSLEHLQLEPSDTIRLEYKGDTYIVRLTKISYSTNKQLICEASLEAGEIYISDAIGSDTNTVGVNDTVGIKGPTDFKMLDIPMLDNAYDSEGIYIAAKGYLSAWNGCTIDKSSNQGDSYTQIGSIYGGTIIGKTTTTLQDGVCHLLDINNTVTVSIVQGELFSIDYETLLNANNYISIGSEILQYQNATNNLDGTFTLDTLLRGRRGTEWATDTHSIGEQFVFLNTNMIFDYTASLNVEYYYKATTFGDFLEDSVSDSITPEIVCKKPLSPWYVKGYRDASNNLIISWMRRSRDVTGYFKTLILMEEIESYEIEIELAGDNRVLTSAEETITYTAADQTTDGITLGNPVTFTVYQISGFVQRGYGTEETI